MPEHKIVKFVERALAGDDVCFSEIENIALLAKRLEDEKLIDLFWRELSIFLNDTDIRLAESEYNLDKKKRLISALDKLIAAGIIVPPE